jgi:hypothetical protein
MTNGAAADARARPVYLTPHTKAPHGPAKDP